RSSNAWVKHLAAQTPPRQLKKRHIRPSFRGAREREPGISNLWRAIPGSMLAHRPGMTEPALRRPDIAQERVDLRAQPVRFAAQCGGGIEHLRCCRARFGGGARDADDIAGDLAGAARR